MSGIGWFFAGVGALALLLWLVCMATDHPTLRPGRSVTERDGEPWYKGDVSLAIAAAESLRYTWHEAPRVYHGDFVIIVTDDTAAAEDALVARFQGPNLDILRRKALGWFWQEVS